MSNKAHTSAERVALVRARISKLFNDVTATVVSGTIAALDGAEEEEAPARMPTAKAVIEHYNRAHGQNPKITLKDVCVRLGVSYDNIRQYRSRERKRKTKK